MQKNNMKRKTYYLDGKEFRSVKALAEYTNIHEKTLSARLRKGMSVEKACEKTDFRCSYCEMDGEEKSVAQICRENSKNAALVRNRLVYGYDMNKALNTPKKVTRQGRPIVVKGVLYNSIVTALDKMNLRHKESTVRRRLLKGCSPDEAFSFEE